LTGAVPGVQWIHGPHQGLGPPARDVDAKEGYR